MGDGQRRLDAAAGQLRRYAFRHAVPIVIAPRNAPPGGLRSATGFFVRLNGSVFLVTAWHVVEHWIGRRGEREQVLFQVDTFSIDPEAGIAWRDQVNDLVFIRVTEQQARATRTSVCEPLPHWPPIHPLANSDVIFVGYPGQLRVREGQRDVLFRSLSAHLVVEEARPNFVLCAFDDRAFTAEDGTQIAVANLDLGGMSGGPVFLVGRLAYPVVALVSECAGPYIRLATLSHCEDAALIGN